MTIQARIVRDIQLALQSVRISEQWPSECVLPIPEVRASNEDQLGDFSSTIGLQCARILHQDPLSIVELIKKALKEEYAHVHISQPGFLHVTLSIKQWTQMIAEIKQKGEQYGSSSVGRKRVVVIESLSKHIVGPVTLAHGRGVYVGDVIGRVLSRLGYLVRHAYIFNDRTQQSDILSESIIRKHLHGMGMNVPYSHDLYPSEYVTQLQDRMDLSVLVHTPLHQMHIVKKEIADQALKAVKKQLNDLLQKKMNARIDDWIKESDLYSKKNKENFFQFCLQRKIAYTEDGAYFLHTSLYGDDKDRLLQKAGSEAVTVYVDAVVCSLRTSDDQKVERVIFILPMEYHGYEKRLKALPQLFGGKMRYEVVCVQSLMHEEKDELIDAKAGMTMEKLIDMYGADVIRFFALIHPLDRYARIRGHVKDLHFRNPLAPVREAYRRIQLCLSKCQDATKGSVQLVQKNIDIEEKRVLHTLARFPELVTFVASTYDVHALVLYLSDLLDAVECWNPEERVSQESLEQFVWNRDILKSAYDTSTIVFNLLGLESV